MTFIHSAKLISLAYSLGLFVFGYFLAKKVSHFVAIPIAQRFSRHHAQLVRRATFYIIFIMFFVTGLQHLGFNLSVLLGAAGVFTVAVSFASQTAASNLISGIFLLFERPFKVGDTIEVKTIRGTVESIDLLSSKLRTSDNTLVRIPNESMMKSEIFNLSYFLTRRIDVLLGVSYQCNIEQVKQLLKGVAEEACDNVLKEPEPTVIIDQFADYAVQLKLMVWAKNGDLQTIKNSLQEKIKRVFDEHGIEMPVQQVTIHQVEVEKE
ncbi:mechanosensitive ion channel [Legionella sp. MW5194]|uniref:mechanosensitive ion channel family protein n=1 Tax=Legionella sp. MW5194 TaxID=2662448 RepID=UPI00193D5E26|nr:mechanosensitive ion channel family protein [Legionella sp. MW5194]QRN04535.1 mechanosensitive ion channel [Legionella sp. MW5194]